MLAHQFTPGLPFSILKKKLPSPKLETCVLKKKTIRVKGLKGFILHEDNFLSRLFFTLLDNDKLA